MGCASGANARNILTLPAGRTLATAPSGARVFPDVSSYQGHPDWALARSHITAAVAKAYEYTQDPDFSWNIATLKALHIPWAAYDFVRSCSAAGFIAVLRSVGGPTSLPPVLDEEVPAANGCTATLEAQIWQAFHRHAIEYTSPGTQPAGAGAGSPLLWIADFGPSYPCLWTCHPVGWQFASPPYRYYFIPGLGYGDVSIDYGLSKLLPAPPKPKPTRAQIIRWTHARDSSQRAYVARGCPATLRREVWFGARLHGPRAAKHRRAFAASRRRYAALGCAGFRREIVYFDRRLHP